MLPPLLPSPSLPPLTGALGLSTFAVLLYNIFGMLVTDSVGAAARVVLENARTLLVWLVSLGSVKRGGDTAGEVLWGHSAAGGCVVSERKQATH